MTMIERANIIENAVTTHTAPNPPTNGVSAVQTLTVTGTPTGGSLSLFLFGETAVIPYNATAAQVQAALASLSSIGTAQVTASGGPLPGGAVAITFGGQLGVMPVPLIAASGIKLTGGTSPAATTATTTAGVAATGRTTRTGTLFADGTPNTGELWQNQGVPTAPNWVKVGTQT